MNRAFSVSYLINIVLQSFWCLLFPIGVAFGIGWLMINKLSWPSWSMVPALIVATFVGLYSMCKFLISATEAMDRMDKQRAAAKEEAKRAYKQRQMLKADLEMSKNEILSRSLDSGEESNNGGDNFGR